MNAQRADAKLAASVHTVTFGGSGLASGMYFYKLVAGSFTQTRKMLLMK